MIALALYGVAAFDLPSHTRFSIFPHLISICTYGMRGIRIRIIVHSVIVAEMHILKEVFVRVSQWPPDRSTVPDSSIRTASSVKSAARAVASLLFHASLELFGEREKLLA